MSTFNLLLHCDCSFWTSQKCIGRCEAEVKYHYASQMSKLIHTFLPMLPPLSTMHFTHFSPPSFQRQDPAHSLRGAAEISVLSYYVQLLTIPHLFLIPHSYTGTGKRLLFLSKKGSCTTFVLVKKKVGKVWFQTSSHKCHKNCCNYCCCTAAIRQIHCLSHLFSQPMLWLLSLTPSRKTWQGCKKCDYTHFPKKKSF